ncbi:MAG TPA: ABC transporter ATP-binding protein [Clostridia bacterium]|nr:ABC transporter ATP-binding protein [Clostridia bacterium]
MQLKNVKKVIGKKTIIDNLTFDVYPGEVFGFLGPNGAGKTTTIRMIAGLISMTQGEVTINGFSVKNNFEEAMSHIGGIVENPEMYKYLTGYQNLIHYARMHKGIGKEKIDELIKTVGLENRIKDKVKTYSLGMRQRLGLAQALLHSPAVLVLDEPTNGLDPAGIREMRDYLRKIAAEQNVAVFVSSHLLSEMELMCDRVGIIQNGKLVDIKLINDLLSQNEDKMPVIIKAEPAEKAMACINNLFTGKEAASKENGIEIILEREEIPKAVAALVQEQIKVYGVQTVNKSLEDKFLELTGGNQIA